MFHSGLLLRNLAWDAIRMARCRVLSTKAGQHVDALWGRSRRLLTRPTFVEDPTAFAVVYPAASAGGS